MKYMGETSTFSIFVDDYTIFINAAHTLTKKELSLNHQEPSYLTSILSIEKLILDALFDPPKQHTLNHFIFHLKRKIATNLIFSTIFIYLRLIIN